MALRTIFLSVIFALLLAGNSCKDVNGSSDDNPIIEEHESFGSFQVTLVAPQGTTPGYTQVVGRIYDGPTPLPIIWELVTTIGDCQLLTPRVPFCEEGCGGTAICVENDSCQAQPSNITAGTVQVEGLLTETGQSYFTMDFIANNYQPVGITLAYPAFAEGDDITFSASGDTAVAAFSITGKGISPLEVLNDNIVLADGQPINLQWTPPVQADIATISVLVDISHHGGTKGKIECETSDDGSLEIAASLVDQLKGLGISGFPKIDVTRKSVATNTSVNIDLVIKSMLTKTLEIPGIISCSSDEDCPEGQTCQDDLKCQ